VSYLPAALSVVIFPKVSELHVLRNNTFYIFLKGMIITLLVTLSGAVVIALFPELLITIALGSKYVTSAPLLRSLAFALIPHALILLILNYNLARSKTLFVCNLIAACLLQWVFIYMYHSQLIEIVYVVGLTGLGVCLVNLIMIFKRAVDYRFSSKAQKA